MAETVAITQLEWEHYNRTFFVKLSYYNSLALTHTKKNNKKNINPIT